MFPSVIMPLLVRTGWWRLAAVLLGFGGLLLAAPVARAQEQSAGTATSPDGKVRVQVISLKRTEGDTVTLRIRVTNNGSDDYRIVLDNARLLDIAGRRSYSPGVTSNNCTTPVGQQLTCWAIFGAPPAATKALAVQFYEHLDLITGVPIGE
ncbi:MAG: hypothetical protein JO047_05695 [Alphaproteobacteria bacterium]|nr:hypothetical protein [Alphaproteobacteria bacterium]